MKKIFLALVLFLSMTGCIRSVPVTEQLTSYNDNSTVYMPVVNTGNLALDKEINSQIKTRLEENYKAIKGERQGKTQEGFTAFEAGDMLSIFQEGAFEEEGTAALESYLCVLHINTKNGKFYTIDDLFIKGYEVELLKTISALLENKLGEYYMTYAPDLKQVAFDVYDGEIVFIFNPEAVAPKHMGFVDIPISLSQIDKLINKEGEMYAVISAKGK